MGDLAQYSRATTSKNAIGLDTYGGYVKLSSQTTDDSPTEHGRRSLCEIDGESPNNAAKEKHAVYSVKSIALLSNMIYNFIAYNDCII